MVKINYINRLINNQILLVCIGSIPGALLRWQLNNDFWSNIIGSTFLGFILGCRFNSHGQVLLGIGFCGSMTTFSGWIFDSYQVLTHASFPRGMFLLLSTLFLGFFSLLVGFLFGTKIRQSFRPQ